jgi:hypothetical protein
MKSILLLIISLIVTGCSSNKVSETVAEIAIEALGNVDISYHAAQCPTVKNNCGLNGHYEEWTQENGKLACACNN